MKYVLIAAVMLSLLSCTGNFPGSSRNDALVHQHELSESHTLYSDSLEFFLEHPAMESGEESEFLIHVTRLSDHSPLNSGTLTLQLGEKSVSAEAPVRPGIYQLLIEAPAAGTTDMLVRISSGRLNEEVHSHVRVYADHHSLHEAVEHGDLHGAQGGISFLKDQAWINDFLVEKVEEGSFHTVIPTSGEFMPMPGEKNNIVANTRGQVFFFDSRLVQGAHVEKGMLLFHIRSENLVENNVEVRHESARNQLELSRSQYMRHQGLYDKDAISEKKYLESRSAYVEDSLNFYMLESHVNEGGISISAPSSGSLHELLVSNRQYVKEGSVLAILSPDKNLMLRVDLPQQYFGYREEIRTAYFRPAYADSFLSVEELGGKLLSVGHSVKENDHYLPVIFLLENQGNILEGAFTEVRLIANPREGVLSIPVSALGEEQGGRYVYVQLGGESYSKRRVSTGPGDGRRVEITGGLEAGERIVTRGISLLKAASMDTGEIGHGHSH